MSVTVNTTTNTVTVSTAGTQGIKGDTGDTGATGPSGVIAVTAPITNSGTSTSATIGIDQTAISITKSQAGLANVDNTADTAKPVSTAQQTALDLKAPLASPTFTGTVALPATTSIGTVSNTELGYVDGVTSSIQTQIDSKVTTPTYAPSGAAPLKSGYYNRPWGSLGAAVVTQSSEYATPFFIWKTTTIDRIGVSVTATAASSVVRIGIRNDSSGVPGTVLLDAGTVDSASSTGEKFITISQSLTPGWYWLTATPQGGAPTVNIIQVFNPYMSGTIGTNTGFSGSNNAFVQTGVTGALGASFTIASINYGICIIVRSA